MNISFQITNDLSELKTLQSRLQALQSVWLLAPKTVAEINLVLEEIITNIIEHGDRAKKYPIAITLSKNDQELTMVVSDEGPSFDPTACHPPDTSLPLNKRKCGGLGIHLVRTFCHCCSYIRAGDSNILTMKRTLPKECR
ncbi:MAG: RsbW1 [uncultured bacterium]|nr:MAG: RsbW1 [uncultured bacterium]